jgi:hypothetical protein
MKYITTIMALLFLSVTLFNCSVSNKSLESKVYTDIQDQNEKARIGIKLQIGESFNHPTYVIWQEDLKGNILKTLFITESYASGIFGHQMVGDSVWLRTSGESIQPAALPYWTWKKGKLSNGELVPSPDAPYTDAYTGATPKGNLDFTTSLSHELPGRIFLEVNQPWDMNQHWTNNRYPDNPAYKHSAQPSLIYAVDINKEQNKYYMNPIGHGDPTGESGLLYTDLRTITSAKQIFESIEINILK